VSGKLARKRHHTIKVGGQPGKGVKLFQHYPEIAAPEQTPINGCAISLHPGKKKYEITRQPQPHVPSGEKHQKGEKHNPYPSRKLNRSTTPKERVGVSNAKSPSLMGSRETISCALKP